MRASTRALGACGLGVAAGGTGTAEGLAAGVRAAGGETQRNAVQECDCLDRGKHCKKGEGAALVVYPDGITYGDVRPHDCAHLVREHLGEGRVVTLLLLGE